MSTALKLRPTALPLPAMPMPVDPLSLLPDFARAEAERCLAIIRPALIRVQQGVSVRAAAHWLSTSAEGMPSMPTVQRWLRDYLLGGIVGLAPKYQGRQRQDRGWEARAMELYQKGSRPGYATVAFWLRNEGHTSANNKAVERYLKALPSNLAETSKKRVGAHYYAQNIRPHVVRDNTVVPVGFIYEGDGHCCDVYVAHPANGSPIRAELTLWIDIRSQYVPGWWMSESESALTTLFSLSQALVTQNHVPAFIHTDPGSGFKARMINDQTAGFLAKFSIHPMLALPGNAKGKGLTEGWFHWFEERLGKLFATYCGHCRTDDELSRMRDKIKRGELVLPTLQQYIDAVRDYINTYNNTPKDGLGGKTPAQMWEQLQRVELHTPTEALLRPRTESIVQRWGVRIDNRKYRAGALQAFEGRPVITEYSIHNDDRVWIYEPGGRFVCEAALVEKKAWLPESRVVEAQERRLQGQLKRLQRKADESIAHSRAPISASAVLDALDSGAAIEAPTPAALALAQGHSIAAPTPPRKAARPVRIPSAETADRAAAAITASELVEEPPQQRYQRWLDAHAALDAGTDIPAGLRDWLNAYASSSECRSFERMREQFGAVSGVVIPATTRPA